MVEEARHRASVRKCNKCKKEFEKVDGCNQVRCSCGNYQCYLCSQSVPSDHSHFRSYGGKGNCNLYDDPKIGEQIERADREAVRKLLQEVPGLKPSDLKV